MFAPPPSALIAQRAGASSFRAILSSSCRLSTHASTKPHTVQMNSVECAAPKIVRPRGMSVGHMRRRITRISVDVHLGQTPVFFTRTPRDETTPKRS